MSSRNKISDNHTNVGSKRGRKKNVSVQKIRTTCENDTIADSLWRCWGCNKLLQSENELFSHLKTCSMKNEDLSTSNDCPICSADGATLGQNPFSIPEFNTHLSEKHSHLESLKCPYCTVDVSPACLFHLIDHVISEHKIPWRPSPSSLSYLRTHDLPHRVVTCMGCGWRAFVLRANSAVQAPTSLHDHMQHCQFNGGRLQIAKCYPRRLNSPMLRIRALAKAELISDSFARSNPMLRGHLYDDANASSLPRRLYENESPSYVGRATPVSSPIKSVAAIVTPSQSPPKKRPRTGAKPGPKPKPKIDKKSASAREGLYVCPLCGDNALSSLRERDEHLASSHNGECVFPCQLCGLALAQYIELRRHAVACHESNFDAVNYGKTEFAENDPVECRICRLVGFTDPAIVKLHLSKMHGVEVVDVPEPDPDSVNQESRGEENDEEETSDNEHSKVEQNIEPPVKIGKKRGRPPGSSSTKKGTFGSNTINGNDNSFQLERLASQFSGDSAPACCKLCMTELDNAKELALHMELDHNDSTSVDDPCEQLGCQACGRIFFGSHGKIDLIGHLRVIHNQDKVDASKTGKLVIQCPNTDGQLVGGDGDGCWAKFSSPRLRQLHINTSGLANPSFACPVVLSPQDSVVRRQLAQLLLLTSSSDSSKEIDEDDPRLAILETEVLADKEGKIILSYCCPKCSLLFAGQQCTQRFLDHSLADTCSELANPVARSMPLCEAEGHQSTVVGGQSSEQDNTENVSEDREEAQLPRDDDEEIQRLLTPSPPPVNTADMDQPG